MELGRIAGAANARPADERRRTGRTATSRTIPRAAAEQPGLRREGREGAITREGGGKRGKGEGKGGGRRRGEEREGGGRGKGGGERGGGGGGGGRRRQQRPQDDRKISQLGEGERREGGGGEGGRGRGGGRGGEGGSEEVGRGGGGGVGAGEGVQSRGSEETWVGGPSRHVGSRLPGAAVREGQPLAAAADRRRARRRARLGQARRARRRVADLGLHACDGDHAPLGGGRFPPPRSPGSSSRSACSSCRWRRGPSRRATCASGTATGC